jgi:aspartyl-tRNA(Asn)/glutamyl-tRNA(Gln) amidotransferase subunit A
VESLVKLGPGALASAVNHGELSALEVVESYFERISRLNPEVNAYIYVDQEGARKAAAHIDAQVKAGRSFGLAGVPVAVKDVLSVKGFPITCGSRILAGYRAPYDSTVVGRLREAGAIILGTTNMDEFAMGSSTENSAYGPSRNPWAKDRVPGGSSGGSAVAVSAGLAPAALGTDTGGSVRLPACFTGLFGLKPSYGALSRYGLVSYANSLEQVGVFTRSVADLALVYSAMLGKDPRDGTTTDFGFNLSGAVSRSVGGLRVGVIRELASEGTSPQVLGALTNVCRQLEHEGASVGEASVQHIGYSLEAYYLVAMSEASSNLARFDGVRYGVHPRLDGDWNEEYTRVRSLFGLEVKRRILLGAYALSAGYQEMYYGRASRFRTLLIYEFAQAFRNFDLLIAPTSPTPPFKFGEKTTDPLTMYLSDVDTVPVNLAGLPALNVPAGSCSIDGVKLPLGVQLIAPYGRDDLLITVAAALERSGVSVSCVVEPWGNTL